MSGSVNKVILVGNLARDPESRTLQDGTKVVHLTVCTSERWKDRNTGEQREKAEFHRCVLFNERLAEVAEKFLAKGRSVYLEGSLQTRKWQDQSGQERYTTEIVLQRFRGELVMLGARADSDDSGTWQQRETVGKAPRARVEQAARQSAAANAGGFDDLDTEIPF